MVQTQQGFERVITFAIFAQESSNSLNYSFLCKNREPLDWIFSRKRLDFLSGAKRFYLRPARSRAPRFSAAETEEVNVYQGSWEM